MKPLQQIISNDIRKTGFISFEEFMKLALYCPVYGYYEKETDKIGQSGDFYTSVSVGSLFGELLAFQFAEWREEMTLANKGLSGAARFEIIEAGAYNGQLARDILCSIQAGRVDYWDAMSYCIVEPSQRLQQKQRRTLTEFEGKVRWVSQLDDIGQVSSCNVHRIIFSNELLDAMPVRRIGWDAISKEWFEWGVKLENEKYAWTKIQQPRIAIQKPNVPAQVLNLLPDGFTTEISPAAAEWWQKAARLLGHGKLLAIDYGMDASDFILPERCSGTLRSYSKHRAVGDLLANPGEQDITAHVNFTAIQAAGERIGLKTDLFVSQEKFLAGIVEQTLKRQNQFGKWNAARRRQLQTLTHPQHLGRLFRVLVQSHSVEGAADS